MALLNISAIEKTNPYILVPQAFFFVGRVLSLSLLSLLLLGSFQRFPNAMEYIYIGGDETKLGG